MLIPLDHKSSEKWWPQWRQITSLS
jgi:hypothetical protein